MCPKQLPSACFERKAKPEQFDLVSNVDKPIMEAKQFCGEWTHSDGGVVKVSFADSRQAHLKAILMKADRKDIVLGIHGTSDGWLCGSAFLVTVSSSKDQLQWSNATTWYREASVSASLSGCQSPSEAYFNPRPRNLWNPTCAFFAGDCPTQHLHSSLKIASPAIADVLSPLSAEVPAPSADLLLIGKVWKKSREAKGCREVQEALSNGNNRNRAAIASELLGHIWEAVESPHANYVLQKCIVEMTPEASQPIVDELKTWKGAAIYLAKHNFGCRVFQRVLEHCPQQAQEMVSEVLADARSLSLHPRGNFIIQHILEHGSDDQRRQLAASLLACLSRAGQYVARTPRFCDNQYAAAVIGKALERAPAKERQLMGSALLQDVDGFVKLALQRFGHVAVKALLKMPGLAGAKARQLLVECAEQLKATRHGRTALKLQVEVCALDLVELFLCLQRKGLPSPLATSVFEFLV